MGGGKSKTYTDFNTNQIFKADDNLYSKELVRLFAVTGRIDIPIFLKSMLDSSRKYFSADVLDALGVTVHNDMAVRTVTDDGILQYICSEFGDCELHETDRAIDVLINYYSTNERDKAIKFDIKKILEAFTYPVDQSFTKTFTQSFEMVDRHGQSDIVSFSEDTYAYDIDGTWYSINTGEIIVEEYTEEWFVEMNELDTNWNETGTLIKVQITEDHRPIYICSYHITDCLKDFGTGDWNCTEEDKTFMFYKEDIVAEAANYRYLILPIKADLNFIDVPDYVDVLLSQQGLGDDTLHDSLNSSEIRDAMLTYSTNSSNSLVSTSIQQVYGTSGNRNNVTLTNDYYNISISASYYCDEYNPDNCFETGYEVCFGFSECYDAESNNALIIPIDSFNKLPMNDRYKLLRDSYRIWGNVEVTKSIAWYQTGFFRIILTLVAVAFAIATGNYWALGVMIGFQIGVQILSKVLSPEVMAIIAIVVGIVMLDFSSAINQFATVANLSNSICQLQFIQDRKAISEEIASTKEQAEADQKILDEMDGDTLYIPFDKYDQHYSMAVGELMYNAYDGMYDSMYNFDSKFKLTGAIT